MNRAEVLRKLHRGPGALLLPNAWDAASAGLIAAAGFPAVGTSSGAIALSIGREDHDSMPVDDAFAAVARIAAAVDVPITADIEAGYQLPPRELVDRLLDAGAAGYNIEDTDHHGPGPLVDADAHAQRLADLKGEARAAGVDLFLNARADVFRFSDADVRSIDEALHRSHLYIEAGADSIFPIRLGNERAIARLVSALPVPINILWRPDTPGIERLSDLGVRRISLGGGLFRTAYNTLQKSLEDLSTHIHDGR